MTDIRDYFGIMVCPDCGAHCAAADGTPRCDANCWSSHSNYIPLTTDVRCCRHCSQREFSDRRRGIGYVYPGLGGVETRGPRALRSGHAAPLEENRQVRRAVRHWQRAGDAVREERDRESEALIERTRSNGEMLLTQGFEPDFARMPPPGVQLRRYDRWGRDTQSTTDWEAREQNQNSGNNNDNNSNYYDNSSSSSSSHQSHTSYDSAYNQSSSSASSSRTSYDSAYNQPSHSTSRSSTSDRPRSSGRSSSSSRSRTSHSSSRSRSSRRWTTGQRTDSFLEAIPEDENDDSLAEYPTRDQQPAQRQRRHRHH